MDVEAFLSEKGVEFRLERHEQAFSAQEVAASEHVTGHMFAKTVIVKDGETACMLVLPASRHVDMRAAGDMLGGPVRLAEEPELKVLFPDCQIGAEPPFGSQYGMDTCMDESLSTRDEIVFRAGTHDRTVRMRYEDYVTLEQPMVGRFTVED
ncbi:MAG: YbaK/EbsC family protein [Candidatus Brocadiaceae bacterium]|nr:YbaK/EbsC family protein [Candidatus Brocadiaceae bacterium]